MRKGVKEFPEVISETYSETLKDRVYGIKQTELIPILVRGMQEQQAQINDLKKRLDCLTPPKNNSMIMMDLFCCNFV